MRRDRDSGEVNYWQSMADGVIGLLLIILLVMMLLLLYLIRIEDDYKDKDHGDSYNEHHVSSEAGVGRTEEVAEINEEDKEEENIEPEEDNASDGSEGEGEEYENVEIIIEELPEEGSDLAAVFVQLMDEETDRTIKKKGIEFELYSEDILQTLSTYYPKKIEYKKFETDENGGFYLPEKIPLKAYQLHELTAVDEYDIVYYTDFEVNEAHRWDEPYVVNVYLSPSKNTIQIKLRDSGDGKYLTFGTFQIIAAEDIVTQDGTRRYVKGAVVDSVSIGDDGIGESAELYLGKYMIRQSEAQQYYAFIEDDVTVDLKKRTEEIQAEACSLTEEKTAVNIVLQDELYSMMRIEGSTIELQDDSGKVLKSGTTNDKGTIRFTDLNKNTTYYVAQKNTEQGYQLTNKRLEFFVDEYGYVNDKSESEMVLTNRMIRISVGIGDMIFRNQITDVNVALMDSESNVIKTWTSNGVEQIIPGLEPGRYQIMIGGENDSAREIVVENKADVQTFSFYIITTLDIGIVCAALALIIFIIVIGVYLYRHKKDLRNSHDRKES